MSSVFLHKQKEGKRRNGLDRWHELCQFFFCCKCFLKLETAASRWSPLFPVCVHPACPARFPPGDALRIVSQTKQQAGSSAVRSSRARTDDQFSCHQQPEDELLGLVWGFCCFLTKAPQPGARFQPLDGVTGGVNYLRVQQYLPAS